MAWKVRWAETKINFMPHYEENLAERLKEQYKLAPGTIRVWKHRNMIPERYIKGFVTREAATKKDQAQICAWLALTFLKPSGFGGVRRYILRDLLRTEKTGLRHARLRREEAAAIKQQMTELRRLLRQVEKSPSRKHLAALVELPFVHPSLLLADAAMYDAYRKSVRELPEPMQQLVSARARALLDLV